MSAGAEHAIPDTLCSTVSVCYSEPNGLSISRGRKWEILFPPSSAGRDPSSHWEVTSTRLINESLHSDTKSTLAAMNNPSF